MGAADSKQSTASAALLLCSCTAYKLRPVGGDEDASNDVILVQRALALGQRQVGRRSQHLVMGR